MQRNSTLRVPVEMPNFDLANVPEEDRDRVEAMIPDPRVADEYIHRYIEGVYDFDYLDGAIADGKNIILAGPTGSAKSTLFKAYCASRRLPYCTVDAQSSMDLSSIIGSYDLNTKKWVDGELTLVVRYGGAAIVEEINMVAQRAAVGFHNIFSANRRLNVPEHGEVIIAGRGGQQMTEVTMENGKKAKIFLEPAFPTLFAATYNPRELGGYGGALDMNQATLNRFAKKFKWGYDREVEAQLLDSPTLLELAWNMRAQEDIRTPVSTNLLMELESNWWRDGWAAAEYFFLNNFKEGELFRVTNSLNAVSDQIVAELEKAESSQLDEAPITFTVDYTPPKRSAPRKQTPSRRTTTPRRTKQ